MAENHTQEQLVLEEGEPGMAGNLEVRFCTRILSPMASSCLSSLGKAWTGRWECLVLSGAACGVLGVG